jgi:ribose transport system substrate-binding protein
MVGGVFFVAMERTTRRDLLKTTGVVGAVGLAGRVGALNGQNQSIQVGFSTYFRGGAWITAFIEATRFYAQDQNIEFEEFGNQESAQKQISDIREMVNQGYDAILVNVWASEAVNSAIEYADEQGVPVFTANVDATTSAVKLYTAFSNTEAAATAAEQMIAECEEEQPQLTGSDAYQILEVKGAPEQQITRQRSEPFVEKIEETDGFEIVDTVLGKFTRSDAQQAVSQWINANGPPDAIYSANLSMGLGVNTALKSRDYAKQRGQDGHIVQVQLDAGPEVITAINNGFIDAAIDQPNYFYGPITLKYMQDYVTGDGEAELPEVGTQVVASGGRQTTPTNETNATTTAAEGGNTETLTIESAQHKGVEMWSEPIWAPAQVVEKDGHRQFRTNSVTVTEENASEPYLWGNIWG